MDAQVARRELTRALQLAHAGEWGAVRAYLGHRHTLQHGVARERIVHILKDEIRHRRRIREMLAALGSSPDPAAERKLNRVGRVIACLCKLGYFIPMYGAGRLERDNIVEYEIAARLAWWSGHREFLDDLLHFAEVEWDHELWLRELASAHWLWKLTPGWPKPPPRDSIRSTFETFTRSPVEVERRTSWLLR